MRARDSPFGTTMIGMVVFVLLLMTWKFGLIWIPLLIGSVLALVVIGFVLGAPVVWLLDDA